MPSEQSNPNLNPNLDQAEALLRASPLEPEEWDRLEALLRSDGWPVLKRYLKHGGRHHERVVRDRKSTIESIRYSQGALDMQDLVTEHLTTGYVKKMRMDLAEAADVRRRYAGDGNIDA